MAKAGAVMNSTKALEVSIHAVLPATRAGLLAAAVGCAVASCAATRCGVAKPAQSATTTARISFPCRHGSIVRPRNDETPITILRLKEVKSSRRLPAPRTRLVHYRPEFKRPLDCGGARFARAHPNHVRYVIDEDLAVAHRPRPCR